MSKEYRILKDRAVPGVAQTCSYCGLPTEKLFMRGMVQSWWRKFWGRPYCACICPHCEEITAWERP
jgi:hypothetical protein